MIGEVNGKGEPRPECKIVDRPQGGRPPAEGRVRGRGGGSVT